LSCCVLLRDRGRVDARLRILGRQELLDVQALVEAAQGLAGERDEGVGQLILTLGAQLAHLLDGLLDDRQQLRPAVLILQAVGLARGSAAHVERDLAEDLVDGRDRRPLGIAADDALHLLRSHLAQANLQGARPNLGQQVFHDVLALCTAPAQALRQNLGLGCRLGFQDGAACRVTAADDLLDVSTGRLGVVVRRVDLAERDRLDVVSDWMG
jgi:hypothetical protein